MKTLEEVVLRYDRKAEEAARAEELQKSLDDAEQKYAKLESVSFFSRIWIKLSRNFSNFVVALKLQVIIVVFFVRNYSSSFWGIMTS